MDKRDAKLHISIKVYTSPARGRAVQRKHTAKGSCIPVGYNRFFLSHAFTHVVRKGVHFRDDWNLTIGFKYPSIPNTGHASVMYRTEHPAALTPTALACPLHLHTTGLACPLHLHPVALTPCCTYTLLHLHPVALVVSFFQH
jgi:hypothetical protein